MGKVMMETDEENVAVSQKVGGLIIDGVGFLLDPAGAALGFLVDQAVVYLSDQVEDLLTRVRSTAGRYNTPRREQMFGEGVVDGIPQEMKLDLEYRELQDLQGSYLEISAQISPGNIASGYLGRGGGRVDADIIMTFDDGEGQSLLFQHDTNAPALQSGVTVLYEIKSGRPQDLIKNGNIAASIRFHDRYVLQIPFGVEGVDIAWIDLEPVEGTFTPSSPGVSVAERMNSLELNFSTSPELTNVRIYRSTDPDFSTSDVDPIEVTNESSYEDFQVDGGQTYYYKIVGVTDEGRQTPASELVSGTPRARYEFATPEFEQDLVTHEPADFSAQLTEAGSGEVVEGAPVTLSIQNVEWTSETLTTDANGEFSADYWAPVVAGSYDLTVEAVVGRDAVRRDYSLSVSERPEVGRNLAIEDVALVDSVIAAGDDVSVDVTVQNRGEMDESPVIYYLFVGRDGQAIDSVFVEVPTLTPNNSTSVSHDLTVPDDTAGEDIALHIKVENDDGFDEQPANALQIRDLHIVEDHFEEPIFRTGEHAITYEETVSIDGTSITLVDYSQSNPATVTFEVSGTETGPIEVDEENNEEFWKSPEGDFIIFPIQLSVPEDPELEPTATVLAGGVTSSNQIHPQRAVTYRGDVGAFRISGSEGDYVTKDIGFLPDEDGGTLQGWNDAEENDRVQDHVIDVNLGVPLNQSIQEYEGLIRWKTEEYRYVSRVALRVAPIHELEVDVDELINNEGIPSNIPGMVISPKRANAEGEDYERPAVLNHGDYVEPVLVEYTVMKDEEILYSEYRDLVVEEEQSFAFNWPTVGSETGQYDLRVMVPHGASRSPDDQVFTSTIEFTEPQPLDVTIADAPEVYSVGDSVRVEAEVAQDDEVIEDASVVTVVNTPGGEQLDLSLQYDDEAQTYNGFFFANTGGNYNLQVFADRRLAKSGSATGRAQAYVDISLTAATESVRLFQPAALNIEVSNVGNVHGIAADVAYDQNLFDLYETGDAGVLSEGGEVAVQQQYDDQGDNIVYGLTRADSGADSGANSVQTQPVASFAFVGSSSGEATFELTEVGLIDSNGESIATRLKSDTASIEVHERSAAFFLSGVRGVRPLHQPDTTSVLLGNAYGLSGASGQISYNPDQVRIIDILEGRAFGSPDKDETLFLDEIDQEHGVASFGVTQIGSASQDAGSGVVAHIVYEPISPGVTDIDLTETALISAYEGREFPHVAGGGDITVPETDTRLSLTAPNDQNQKNGKVTLVIDVAEVDDLFAFSGNIDYDADQLEFVRLDEGNFLNGGEEGVTSLIKEHDGETGQITVGLSRMAEENGGKSADGAAQLLSLTFARTSSEAGTLDVDLTDTALIQSDGVTRLPHRIEVAELAMPATSTQLRLTSPDGINPSDDEVTVAVEVKDVEDLFSFAGDITYDPQHLELVEVQEGNLLNEGGDVGTSFTTEEDPDFGELVVGISRLGADKGGITTEEAGTLFLMTFDRLTEDSLNVGISNTGLLRPDGQTKIPHLVFEALYASPPFVAEPIDDQALSGDESFSVDLTAVFSVDEGSLSYQAQSSDASVATVSIDEEAILALEPLRAGSTQIEVRAEGEGGVAVDRFTVTVEPGEDTLEAPELRHPMDDATGLGRRTLLSWVAVDGIHDYQVQVATDPSFQNVIVDEEVGRSDIDVDNLVYSRSYYWRVRLVAGEAVGPWSEEWRFLTVMPPEASESATLSEGDEQYEFEAVGLTLSRDAGQSMSGMLLNHNGSASAGGEVTVDFHREQPYEADAPDRVGDFAVAHWRFQGDGVTFENGTVSTSLDWIEDIGEDDNLTWLLMEGNTWVKIGGEIDGNKFRSTEPVDTLTTFAIAHVENVALVVSPIADQNMEADGELVEIDLETVFDNPLDGDLSFSAASTDEEIVSTEVQGSSLIVKAHAIGDVTITVQAENAEGTNDTSFDVFVEQLAAVLSRDFGNPTLETSYRLVGLPGQIDADLAATLSGESGSAWRAFRETGAEGDDPEAYLDEYDGSDAFRFAPGRGFWLLSRDAWEVDQTVDAVELSGDGFTTMPLHEGWNIFSNPLDQPVGWDATLSLEANEGLTEALWQWDGSWQGADTLRSARTGEAYYLFNDGDLEELTLQHPAFADDEEQGDLIAATQAERGELQLITQTRSAGTDERQEAARLALGHAAGDAIMHRLPPAHFAAAQLSVRSELLDAPLGRLLKAAPEAGEGLAFDVELTGIAEGDAAYLYPEGLGAFEGEEVVLVHTATGARHTLADYSAAEPLRIRVEEGHLMRGSGKAEDTLLLQLLIGDQAFVDGAAERPDKLAFGAVYPNPSDGQVTIEVAVPETMALQVELFNVLGQQVGLLHSGELAPGVHELSWDGRTTTGAEAASGVYLLRLMSPDGQKDTGRLTRVR